MRDSSNLPTLLQSFFTTRLMTQRKASPHAIASYRDTFRLLLQFAQRRLRKAPSQLELNDLDGALIDAFLEDLEKRRRNGARSRNLRLTAIRHSSGMPRWRRLHRAESFNGCWPFPTNDSHVPWWVFSRSQRSKRCWRRRIERLGWDAVTMLSCSPPFRPA
jgi:hypothetical protein